MTEPPDDIARRASDRRFLRGRAELAAALRTLLGPRAPEPVENADRAADVAAEARAGHRAAGEHPWAVVRHAWRDDDRAGFVAVLHAVSALAGARPVWLVVPGREPQAVAVDSDAVLDNPLGFIALAEDGELVLLDRDLPAGLWLGRYPHAPPPTSRDDWVLEVWGAEPWLSAATRALRESR